MAVSGDGLQEGPDGVAAVLTGLLAYGATAIGNMAPMQSVSQPGSAIALSGSTGSRLQKGSSMLAIFLTHAIGVPTMKACQSLTQSMERSLVDTKLSIVQEADRKIQESVKQVLALPSTWQQKAIAKVDETVQNTLHTIATIPTKAPQVVQQAIVESMPVRLGRAMFKCFVSDVKGLFGK